MKGLEVRWFDRWTTDLTHAAKTLAAPPYLPHDLLEAVMREDGPAAKRSALVLRRGEPIAVVPVRKRRDGAWGLVCQDANEQLLMLGPRLRGVQVLAALDTEVYVRTTATEPTAHPMVRDVSSAPTYRVKCDEDFEAYWHATGQMPFIQSSRRKTRRFEMVTDESWAPAWVLKESDQRWSDPDWTDSLADRVLLAAAQQRLGFMHTLVILKGERPAAGITLLHDGGSELVAHFIHADQSMRAQGVGTRVIELAVLYAKEHGFQTLNLGSGPDYKAKWGSAMGREWSYHVRPTWHHVRVRANRNARRVASRVLNAVPHGRPRYAGAAKQ